jgi:hypothetical protein
VVFSYKLRNRFAIEVKHKVSVLTYLLSHEYAKQAEKSNIIRYMMYWH